jgi:hypothetical protein
MSVTLNTLYDEQGVHSVDYDNLNRVIIPFIAKTLNKHLNDDDLQYIINRLSHVKITKTSLPAVLKSIIENIKHPNYVGIKDSSNNIKEYLNSQIGTTDEDNTINPYQFSTSSHEFKGSISLEVALFLKMGVSSLFNMSKKINPKSKEYYSYIMLDTDNVVPELSTDNRFVWRLNDGSPVYNTGTINLPHKLYSITKMRIGRITLANIHYAEYNTIRYSASRRFATTLHNFSAQSIIPQNGNKFHFLHQYKHDVENRGNTMTITPFFSNRGWFRFNKPHRNTDIIEMSIADIFTPETPLNIPKTYATVTGVQDIPGSRAEYLEFGTSRPLTFSGVNHSMLELRYGRGITPTTQADPRNAATTFDAVTISGFTTDDPVGDAAVIDAYNSTHVLTRVFGDNDLYDALGVGYGVFNEPVNTSSVTLSTPANITVTWQLLPRLTTVVELISELPPGEKLI